MRGDLLERITPDELRPEDTTGEETLRLHIERYEFAAAHSQPGRLLDLACGTGYGTRLLTDRGRGRIHSTGVDNSEEAIDYAKERYGNDQTDFVVCDAMEFTDVRGFDTIVSLETIEHLSNPGEFIQHLVALLRPGGHLVASVPTTPSVDANPHHLHDFSEQSFRNLLDRYELDEIDAFHQKQPFQLGGVLHRSEPRMKQLRRNLPAYYLSHPPALARRIWSMLRNGFVNKYITIAWEARA